MARRITAWLPALVLLAGACARSPFAPPECADGVDNDGDGRTDMEDEDCSDPGDDGEGSAADATDFTDAEATEADGRADHVGEDADHGTEADDVEADDDGAEEADSSCTTGCWTGTACVDGTELGACGTGGNTCRDCDDGLDCTADTCEAGACGHTARADDTTCTEVADGACLGGACARVWTGTDELETFGLAVALGPDVTGDGSPDSVIGAPGFDSNRGRAYIFSGTRTSWTEAWDGPEGGQLGWSAGLGSDLDGDTAADLLAGAPYTTVSGSTLSGLVRLVPGGSSFGTPVDLEPPENEGQFGFSVALGAPGAGPGCVGRFVVGAPMLYLASLSSIAGRVWAYDDVGEPPCLSLDAEAAMDRFGASVAAGPDLDDPPDGRNDLLIGAPHSNLPGAGTSRMTAGRAYLYSTREGRNRWVLDGPEAECELGSSVSLGPDLNGNGTADAIVGAPGCALQRGAVYARDGRTGSGLWTPDPIVGEEAGSLFGASVSAGPDATGDGTGDVLVGAPGFAGNRGRAYLLSGTTGEIVRVFDGVSNGDGFGWSVSLGPDVDGDGLADILVGAPYADRLPGANDAGRAYLFVSSGWSTGG